MDLVVPTQKGVSLWDLSYQAVPGKMSSYDSKFFILKIDL